MPSQLSFSGLCPVTAAVSALSGAGAEKRGAIFTRREVVEFILDLAGYTADRPLRQSRLLEPAFGDGDFLIPANRHGARFMDRIPRRRVRESPRPFVGWLMMVEDAPESRRPVRDASPHFPVFPEFQGASYLKRYDVLCQRLAQEQLYTTAAILGSPRSAITTGEYSNMSDMTSLKTFVTSLAGHVAAEAARAS